MNKRFHELFVCQSLLLIIVLGSLGGCGPSNLYIKPTIPIPVKESEKIPLYVGLYLDPKFINYWDRSGKARGTVPATIHIGEALSKGAEDITKRAFKEVIVVQKKDPESIPKELDALVIPEVENIHNDMIGMNLTASVKVKWTILAKDGKTLYLNAFAGEHVDKRLAGNANNRTRENYEKAVVDSMIKAYIGISTTNWWKSVNREAK